MSRLLTILFASLALTATLPMRAQSTVLSSLKTLLANPNTVDYAKVQMLVDQTILGNRASPNTSATLESMANDIQNSFPTDATTMQRFQALRDYLYRPGHWNEEKIFTYDHSDPLGTNLENKTMSRYLTYRKGNCVSMPVLMVLLADRLAIPMSLATAPSHVFAVIRDPQSGLSFNVEATSGGHFARDEWYQKTRDISSKAIDSGLYLRELTRIESATVIAVSIADFFRAKRELDKAQAIYEYLLTLNPRFAHAMLSLAAIFYQKLEIQIRSVPVEPGETRAPAGREHRHMDYLKAMHMKYLKMAEDYGWMAPSPPTDRPQ